MAQHQAARRSPLLRVLGLVALLTTVAISTGAATTASASASGVGSDSDGVYRDDVNQTRIVMNADRAEITRRLLIASVDATPTAADRERASRDLVRKVLARPVYVRPVPGPVTQWYGTHPGIDIAPPYGTPIVAAHAGVVTFVGWQDGYGMHVEVAQSDGYVTTYSHMSGFTTNVGQLVKAGQQLGMVGSTGYSTGPHLHFEVHQPDGQRMDPAIWLREHGVSV